MSLKIYFITFILLFMQNRIYKYINEGTMVLHDIIWDAEQIYQFEHQQNAVRQMDCFYSINETK